MKIALLGASGTIGQRILNEALSRGHEVTGIVRNPARLTASHPHVKVVKCDVLDSASVAQSVAGHEVVISAISPSGGDPQRLVEAARSLLDGLKRSGVRRLIVVGGAGSLEVASGVALVDTPEFRPEWKPTANAHRDALAVYRSSHDLDWTFFSPAGLIQPGTRTGKFRIGGDQLLTDENGKSFISCEDYAVALLDEVENPKHIQQRFTVAY